MKLSLLLRRELIRQARNKNIWRSWHHLPWQAIALLRWASIEAADTHPIQEYEIAISLALYEETRAN